MSFIILILNLLTVYVSIKFNIDYGLLMEINFHFRHSITYTKAYYNT